MYPAMKSRNAAFVFRRAQQGLTVRSPVHGPGGGTQTLEAKSQVRPQVDWLLRLPRARPQTAETGPACSFPWGWGPFTQQKLLFCTRLRMAATFRVLSWGCCGQAAAGCSLCIWTKSRLVCLLQGLWNGKQSHSALRRLGPPAARIRGSQPAPGF